jgi:hypothetical protein
MAAPKETPQKVTAEPTPVGDVVGAAAEKEIGPAGDSVVSADGQLAVVVPKGALSTNTTIRVEPISNTAWGGLGDAYRLSPDGQAFQKPVELRFSYGDQEVEGSAPESLRVAYQDGKGLWRSYKEVALDSNAALIRVTTTHFTDWARVTSKRIEPAYSMIAVTQKIELVVESCLADEDTSASTSFSYLARCSPIANNAHGVKDWAANGIPDGDDSVGRISGDAAAATYTAPALPPTENPVKVTAREIDESGTVLTAQVLVGLGGDRPEVWRGTVTQELNFSGSPGAMTHETLTANVVFEGMNSSVGGGLALTGGDYQADILNMIPTAGGCRSQGTESGDFPATGSGTLDFSSVPFESPTYNLDLTIDESYDGVNNCNGRHQDEPYQDFEFVMGVKASQRPYDPTLDVIDDSFDEPYQDGTRQVTIHLVKQ